MCMGMNASLFQMLTFPALHLSSVLYILDTQYLKRELERECDIKLQGSHFSK